MAPFLVSVLLLAFLTIAAVLLFKKFLFSKQAIECENEEEHLDAYDKALMVKHKGVDIYSNRKYFWVAAFFITMVYVITFVEYPTLLKGDEQKADPKAVQNQTQQIEITEQQPEKPAPKQKKPRKEQVVEEEEIEVDSTDQEELLEFLPDFGEAEEEYVEEEEEYVPPIVERAEVRAEFPGGPPAFMRWAYNNIQIPEKDKQNGVKGMVMVQFVVYEDGFVRDIEIIKGLSPSMDQAVKELMERSPKWAPGKTQGQVVRERWRYPIKIVPR